MSEKQPIDRGRRHTIKLVAGAAGTAAVGSLGIFTAACGGARAAPDAVTRVALTLLPVGARVKIDHHGEPVELQRDANGVVARSLICTHEYCRMFWHPASNGYRCPCHGAEFGPDGTPRSGPIGQAMWTLLVRVEADEVVIGGV